MRNFIGGMICVISIILAIYVGGWVMFIHPIISACQAYDAGILTGTMIGITVIKVLFASFVATLIAKFGCAFGMGIME